MQEQPLTARPGHDRRENETADHSHRAKAEAMRELHLRQIAEVEKGIRDLEGELAVASDPEKTRQALSARYDEKMTLQRVLEDVDRWIENLDKQAELQRDWENVQASFPAEKVERVRKGQPPTLFSGLFKALPAILKRGRHAH